jgi:homoserine kinase type II
MGRFTELALDDAREIAAAFGLGEAHALDAIPAGTINSNFALDTGDGRYFLRVNEGKCEEEVAWEAELVVALARADVPAPVPLATPTGRRYLAWRGRWISVFPWCAGRHLAPSEVTPDAARALGRALATMHLGGLTVPPAQRRPSRYAFAALVDRLAAIEAATATTHPELADTVAVLLDEKATLQSAATVRDAATHGVIHGDLFRDNVLWSKGRVAAILDFEQASSGSLVYDLAVCLNDWCWSDGPSANLASAMVAGYQDVRPLPPEDLMAVLIEVRAAAWRFTITRLTDVYLPEIDYPEKDFRDFFQRLVAWRAGGLAGF